MLQESRKVRQQQIGRVCVTTWHIVGNVVITCEEEKEERR